MIVKAPTSQFAVNGVEPSILTSAVPSIPSTVSALRLATTVVLATTRGAVPVTISLTNWVPVIVKAPTSQFAVNGIVPSASKSPEPPPIVITST